MNSHLSSTLLGRLATAAGATWAATAVMQITHRDELAQSGVETTIQHVALAGFSLALVLTAFGDPGLARYATNAKPAKLAVGGLALLALASTGSNINGEDAAWFIVAAPLANLAWLAGSIWLAVSLRRAGQVPAPVAFALPALQVLALPLAVVGGMMAAGRLLAGRRLDARRGQPAPRGR